MYFKIISKFSIYTMLFFLLKLLEINSFANLIDKEYDNFNIKPIVNEKHKKNLDIKINLNDKILTYSFSEKRIIFWDQKTKKKLKEFADIKLNKIFLDKNKIYFKEYKQNTIFFSFIDTKTLIKEIIIKDNNLKFDDTEENIDSTIIIDNSFIFPSYGNQGIYAYYYEYNFKKGEVKLTKLFGSKMGVSGFKLLKKRDLVYHDYYGVINISKSANTQDDNENWNRDISIFEEDILQTTNTKIEVITFEKYKADEIFQNDNILVYYNDEIIKKFKKNKPKYINADPTDFEEAGDYLEYYSSSYDNIPNWIKNELYLNLNSETKYQIEHYPEYYSKYFKRGNTSKTKTYQVKKKDGEFPVNLINLETKEFYEIERNNVIAGNQGMCGYDSIDYITQKNRIIFRYYCQVGNRSRTETLYIIDENGIILRKLYYEEIEKLNFFDDKGYLIHEDKIEILDDDFQTLYTLENTYSSDIKYIEKKGDMYLVYFNNIIMYYDYETQEHLYTKYIIDKDTEITILKEGFIDGKGNFEDYVHFLDDKYKVYTINQFYDFFYRPDLVKLKLQRKDISQYTNGLTYQDALKNPPPKIDILKVENQNVTVRKDKNEDVTLSNDKTTLNFNVLDNNGGVGLIRVYQEGKLIKTFGNGEINKQAANIDTVSEQENINDKVKLAQNEYIDKMQNSVSRSINETVSLEESVADVVSSNIQNKAGEYSIDLDLISGKNEITIEAFNSSNTISSYKESINIISNVDKKEPTLYAIVTGVNEFEANYVSNLKYSQNDAKAIKELIEKEKGKSYKNIEIKYLIGKDLTKEKVNEAIEDIKQKAKLEDALVFYISTHGKNYKGKLMLVPQNNKSVKNLISFEDLFKNLQSVKTLKQVFILDTCESGSANDIVSSIYDSKASVLAKSSGVHMLLATTKGTFAFEHPNPNIKHGVFTNNILTALKDKSTDKNKDKAISVIELSKILQEPKYIVDHQYPIIRNIGNDVPIASLSK